MLSIGKLTPGRANYYVDQLPSGRDEYYLKGEQDGQARWLGAAAEPLGLHGDVTPEAFRLMLGACHPLTGEPLGVPRTTARRVAGFDLCFSAPKSVSVLWALGGPEIASAAASGHDRAVAAAIEALEAEAVRARRGAGGAHLEETGGVAAAAFDHRSSRAGDPQIHTHVVVANLTPDLDGRWTSLYGARVYRWAKTIGFIYQAELRANLTRDLGVTWTPIRNGLADIDGIPDEVCKAFSARRAQIEQAMADLGASSATAAQTATLATRPAKSTVADLATLREEWLIKAAELGLAHDFTVGLLGRSRTPNFDLAATMPRLLGPDGLTGHSSNFDRRDVIQALASVCPDGASAGLLRAGADRVIGDPSVVALAREDPAGPRYTTADLLAVESRLIERAQNSLDTSGRTASPAQLDRVLADRPTLSDEQRRMVTALTTSDAAVQVVIGRAGTGKTFALDAARAAWELAGRPVIGTALAARAAAELQAGAGIPSTTIDRLLADLERPGPLSGLAPHTVVVVDEAGMVGTRKLDRLLDHTRRSRASVILVGDHRQLPEIEAGGILAGLTGRVPTVELTDNRRQQHAWERDALSELRAGSVLRAVEAYQRRRRVTLADTADAAREQMVADWWAARAQGQRVGMYALRRADVEDLNRRARQRLQSQGIVGPDELTVAGRSFAPGDEVMCLRNDRRLGVRNGTVSTIDVIHGDDAGVTLADGTGLPHEYLAAGHLGHAYAATIHKSQGMTVDRALLLGSDALYREAGYVGLSRARERSDLYLVAAHPAGPEQGDDMAELNRHLARSQAQQLALDQLEPHPLIRARAGHGMSPERAVLLADPAPWLVAALGPPPLSGPDRERWAERAARIDAYRDIYAIDGLDPLGPRPDDPDQLRAWELARLAVLELTRSLELGLDQGLEL